MTGVAEMGRFELLLRPTTQSDPRR